jgi:hypothetical protein
MTAGQPDHELRLSEVWARSGIGGAPRPGSIPSLSSDRSQPNGRSHSACPAEVLKSDGLSSGQDATGWHCVRVRGHGRAGRLPASGAPGAAPGARPCFAPGHARTRRPGAGRPAQTTSPRGPHAPGRWSPASRPGAGRSSTRARGGHFPLSRRRDGGGPPPPRRRPMGHEARHACRPLVAPWHGQDARDEHPEDGAARDEPRPRPSSGGPPVVTPVGPGWPPRAARCARGQWPWAGQGPDVPREVRRAATPVSATPTSGRVQAGGTQAFPRARHRIVGGQHRGGPAAAGSQPPPRPGETPPGPTRHPADPAHATRGGRRRPLACRVAQRRLPPPCGVPGALATPGQDPRGWRRTRAPPRPRLRREDGGDRPWGRPDPPPGRPIRQGRRPGGLAAVTRAWPRGPTPRHDQPAAAQHMRSWRAADRPRARRPHLIALAGDVWVTPPGSRSGVWGEVGSRQQPQEPCGVQGCSRVPSCPRDSSPVTFEEVGTGRSRQASRVIGGFQSPLL